ncbi:hypothetical protein GN244_ATG06601 [Phytophthora infestans]|uniref:Uncharacterized protein n=1 Tax=Phytophthora infestans TaxID=4787 RepID=A0A833SZT7_PHYIN|nr:hypothetical protein GN244_ATG06601 [Phytophthora infestans]
MSSHRAPNATLGTGHPDFSERGIYLYETSPMMDEDLLLENFRNHVVGKFGFTSVSFHHRGTKLLNELIRHAGNRSRQSESFEYITFVVGSRPLHCIFPDKVAIRTSEGTAFSSPSASSIHLHQENEKQEFQVFLEQEIPPTDVKRIYMTEIQDSLVVEKIQLQTMQLQNAVRLNQARPSIR